MIFETLWESAQRGELLLVTGGFCHWHLRRDGQLTIREIIATRPGAGTEMLAALIATQPVCIVAKCPADLTSNAWYARKGFALHAVETTKTGREVNVWRLPCSSTVPPATLGLGESPSTLDSPTVRNSPAPSTTPSRSPIMPGVVLTVARTSRHSPGGVL